MAKAVCVNCEHPKRKPYARCDSCALDPTKHDEALVRSVYLSIGRFADPQKAERYARDLDDIGAAIRRGEAVEYDLHELERLRLQQRMVSSATRRHLCGVLVRFFLPGLVFVLGLWALFYVLSWLLA